MPHPCLVIAKQDVPMILPQLRIQDSLLAGCCILLFSVEMGSAGVVTDCTEANLRAAMEGGGLVTFVCDGTITLGSPLVIRTNTALDGRGHNVILSGNHVVRVFNLSTGVNLTLTGLTIANGSAESGAGIFNDGGQVEVTSCIFSNNLAFGAACADACGGAVWNAGVLRVRETTFINNRAFRQSTTNSSCVYNKGSGGAVFNQGTASVCRTLFEGNGSSGSVYYTDLSYSVRGGSADGAAICNSGVVGVTNSTFFANQCLGANTTGAGTITGIAYGGDAAGAGIYNYGQAVLVHNTFSSNTVVGGTGNQALCDPNFYCGGPGVGAGGAVYNAGVIQAMNCIFAHTPSGGDTFGLNTNSASNLFGPTDPQLEPLQANGGSTKTMALLPASPAIDAGDPAACAPTDQRGVARPIHSGCDIGAYEYDGGLLPPLLAVNFSPSVMLTGTQSRLQIALTNVSVLPLAEVSFTNRLPANLVVAAVSEAQADCAGNIVAFPGSNTFFVTGMTIPPSQTCTIRLNVTTASLGRWSNSISTVAQPALGYVIFTNGAALSGAAPPAVTTGPPDDIQTNSASITAFCAANGVLAGAWFQWGTNSSLGNNTPAQSVGSDYASRPVREVIGDLPSGATIFYRLAATNIFGATYGEILTFPVPDNMLYACDDQHLRVSVGVGGHFSFACDGMITVTNTLRISQDVDLDGTGRSVTIDGANAVRVFHVDPGVRLTLRNITIANGHSTNGAGIYNDGGIVTLIDCALATNRAVGLPGPNGADAPQDGSRLRGGDASPGTDGKGGGIFNAGTLRITNTVFRGNSAEGGASGNGGRGGNSLGFYNPYPRCQSLGPGGGGNGANGGNGFGGAIYNVGDVVLFGVSADGNRTVGGAGGHGGAIGNAACIIISPPGNGGDGSNGGSGRGGVVYNQGRLDVEASALFNNTTVGGNGGLGGGGLGPALYRGADGVSGIGSGGAIFNSGTNALVNVTMAFNTSSGGDCADGVGGAFDNAGRILATNCTIWANTSLGGVASNGCSMPGGSLAASVNTQNGALTLLLNCIVGSLISTTNCVGGITDGGHNICSDASAAFSAPGSLNSTDPKLGPLADNGGATRTIGLEPGSPAIDGGDSSQCPFTDQRGVTRPVGPACDIGAFEGGDGLRFPTLRISFSPSTIQLDQTARLIFSLSNPNPVPLAGFAFTNVLTSFFVANPLNSSNGCGATVLADPGSTNIIVTGIGLPADGSCIISVDVAGWLVGNLASSVGYIANPEMGGTVISNSAKLTTTEPKSSTWAVQFDGTDDLIYTAKHVVNPAEFTVGLWFKTAATNGGPLLCFSKGQISGGDDRFLWMNASGHLGFGVMQNFGSFPGPRIVVRSPGSYNDGRWHHVAATLSGIVMRLYADGDLVVETSLSGSNLWNFSGYWLLGFNNDPTWRSEEPTPYSFYFRGEMDEVQVWNRSLSFDETRRYLRGLLTGTEPGLQSYWRLDESVGLSAYDATGNGNTATLYLGPVWVPSTAPILAVTPIQYLPDGTAKLQFLGQSGLLYTLQASTNLIDWAEIAAQPAGVRGLWEFTDAEAANLPWRIYRLR
jgi:hypothetical protein